ncbi:hypothetical protein [Shewanella algidipiscicola]|uniref:Uncharacterized protein n=1 Tax=Shewanella algidipiscicola TaxID=614070 RepID=A0ABQ4PDZ4_9GAMM|nr:hypothetical protein [Shewanella algidipiscicola]GIU45773.1 hypothetical protein TUM4630_14630 [Shewanella algidipiscicola]
MGAFAVAFILISGYLYVSNSKYQKYITRREDGHRYYFRCGSFGILFCVVGIFFAVVCDYYNWPSAALALIDTSIEKLSGPTSKLTVQEYLNAKLLAGSAFALPIAFAIAWIENYFRDDDKSRKYINDVKSPALEKFLFECGETVSSVLITLASRKVYVGLVHEIPIEAGEVEHFTILPMLSGYRDKDRLTVKFTTNYFVHYENQLDDAGDPRDEGVCLDDFIEVIPVSEMVHIGRFDIDTYKNFGKPLDGNGIHMSSIPWVEPPSSPIDSGKPTDVHLS